MEQIRDLLRKHIEVNGYTIYSISIQSGINRTNLQKILSGQRKLTPEVYERLLPFLSLSPREKDELDKAFLIDRIGSERYQTHMQVKNIFELPAELLNQYTDTPADTCIADVNSIPDYMLLHDRFKIMNMVYSIIFNTVSRCSDPFLYMYADMSDIYVPTLLKQFYNSYFDRLRIVQLLEFRKVHVIFLSHDFETAFFVSDEDFRQHYLGVYSKAMGKSHLLTNGQQSASELLDQLIDVAPSTNYPLCINVQPTLEKYFTPELIDKYILDTPHRDILRAKLLHRISQLKLENHTIMFTNDGLELFTKHGKNINFPDELARHIDIPDRISILQQLIHTNNDPDDCTFLLLDDRKLHTSLNLTIAFVPPMTTYLLIVRADGSSMVIPLQERTICSSIMDFVQNMPEYGLVLSAEQTNAVLQKHIDELRQQL